MSWYTTPLQIGYFFALLMALVFFVRGWREERLSDRLLGFLMLILALELQDYTFGFAGINFLWTELNGFPRDVSLLFGPTMFFYLRSQVNVNFKLEKKHGLHLIPWLLVFLLFNFIFWNGKDFVQSYQQSDLSEGVEIFIWLIAVASYAYYFYHSINLYKSYRSWVQHQFSSLNSVDLKWFKNFIYFMVTWVLCKLIFTVLDFFLDLNYFQDWWWNLPLAATALYIGLEGFRQKHFQAADYDRTKDPKESIENLDPQIKKMAKELEDRMKREQFYLQPELNLKELAAHLEISHHQLSALINQGLQINFNDYINLLRIENFEDKVRKGQAKQLTLLSLAYESGFNSKATFHRAYKKLRGKSPKEFMQELEG